MAQQGLPKHVVTAMAIPSNATLVEMSWPDKIHPTWVKNNTTPIWTKGLADCVAVAT